MKKRMMLCLLPLVSVLTLVGCNGGTSSAASDPASSSSASISIVSNSGTSTTVSSALASSSSAAESSAPVSSSEVSSDPASSSVASSSSSSQSDYVPFIKTPTEITLWSITGQNNQAQLQNYIDEFTAKEPNVTVTNTIQTGMGYNELKNAVTQGFATGNYPDMVQCYPDHVAEYIEYGKSVNLDSYINNSEYGWSAEDKADYIEGFVEEGQQYSVPGTYSVPYCKSTEGMFYNASVLVGLDLSTIDNTINNGRPLNKRYLENLTWEELFDKLCPAIVAYNDTLAEADKILKSNEAYHAVFAYDSDDNLFITLAEQYGAPYTSINQNTGKGSFDFVNDQMKSIMRSFNNAAKKGYIISKGSAGNNYTNTYFTAQNTLFSVGSTGGVKYQLSKDFDVNIAPIPHPADKNLRIINQGPSLTMLNHDADANKDNKNLASWLLYNTITNAANSTDWAINSGYMGVRKSNYVSEDYLEASDESNCDPRTLELLMAKNMNYTGSIVNDNVLYTSPAFKGSSAARTAVSGIMTKVLTTTNNIEDLDSWFTEALNACLLAA